MLLINQCIALITHCASPLVALLGETWALAGASLQGDQWPFEVFGALLPFSQQGGFLAEHSRDQQDTAA